VAAHRGCVAALVLMLGQAAGQQFVGAWTMNLRGQTYAKLELQTLNVKPITLTRTAP